MRRPLIAEIGFAGRAPRQVTIEYISGSEVALSTSGFQPGVYQVRYRLKEGEQTLAEVQRELILDATIAPRIAALRKQQQALPPVPTVEYILDTISRATREYAGSLDEVLYPMAATLCPKGLAPFSGPLFHLERDLAQVEKFLRAAGDPLAGAQGDFRMAFRSPADQSLQPYRLLLPAPREGVKTYPLIIALHDALGDENSYIERYHIDKLAAERGYIVVCPAGRGAMHMYGGQSEKDVLDLLDVALAILPVDKRAVFLTGHSMGSFGTLQIGTRYADRFAALAAVAGVPAANLMNLDAAPRVRLRLYQGAKDDVTPPDGARRFADIAKFRFKEFAYVERPGDDHVSIATTTLPEIFDFFDAVRKGSR